MKKGIHTIHDYNFKYHLVGRIWTALAIVLFIMVPVTLGLYYKVTPDWSVFGTWAIIVPLIINFFSGVIEPIIYAPMLGTNSEYLAFITGNLSNLKIPCVVKAQEICGTKVGTEEQEVVSTLAVATSTLVTVVIVGIVVLCLAFSNLQTTIQRNTWVMPAFTCVVYALFGSLGGKYVAKSPKLAAIPAAIVVVLSIILGVVGLGSGIGSAYLFVGIGVCAICTVLQIVLEKKKQAKKQDLQHIGEIASVHELSAEVASDAEAESTGAAETSEENSAENSEDIH